MSYVWKTLGVVLLVGSLGWGTYSVVGVLAHDEYGTRSKYPIDDVDRLVVDGDNGSVSVAAGDVDEVVVKAEISDGWKRSDVSQEVVDGELRLDVECPVMFSMWCGVDYTVTVPTELASRLPVDIDWSNGRIEVSDVDGPITIGGHNGAIEVNDVRGKLRIDGSNGRITATGVSSSVVEADSHNGAIDLEFVRSPDRVVAKTSNGSVDVAVPDEAGVTYDVELETTNGDPHQDVAHDPRSDRTIALRTHNGDVTTRYTGATSDD